MLPKKAGTKAYKGVEAFVDFSTKKITGYEADPAKVKNNDNLKNVIELVSNIKKHGATIGAIISVVDLLVVGKKNAASSTSNPLFTASGALTDGEPFDGLTFLYPVASGLLIRLQLLQYQFMIIY